MEAETVSETSEILSALIRLSARQGFIYFNRHEILNFDNANFTIYLPRMLLANYYNHIVRKEVVGNYTTALSQKECREKGNLHDQDSGNKRAAYI
jgi:hypothetical protein